MKKSLSAAAIKRFQKKIYDNYDLNGRVLPWRKNLNPYRVLISEIMLQQTQVERVTDKYKQFLEAFPDFPSLARAPMQNLLKVWSGMGYNRRALALKALAQKVVTEHRGKLPSDVVELVKLPGIGKYTAGAVMAFAFNKPVVFLDTNVRRVYIHEFLHGKNNIHDNDLIPLVERTLDRENPRKWYNALMDYGTLLKRRVENPNRRSVHYSRQSPFENSNRQTRGMILKVLLAEMRLSETGIIKRTGVEPERVKMILAHLQEEGFIRKKGKIFFIGGE